MYIELQHDLWCWADYRLDFLTLQSHSVYDLIPESHLEFLVDQLRLPPSNLCYSSVYESFLRRKSILVLLQSYRFASEPSFSCLQDNHLSNEHPSRSSLAGLASQPLLQTRRALLTNYSSTSRHRKSVSNCPCCCRSCWWYLDDLRWVQLNEYRHGLDFYPQEKRYLGLFVMVYVRRAPSWSPIFRFLGHSRQLGTPFCLCCFRFPQLLVWLVHLSGRRQSPTYSIFMLHPEHSCS